MLINYLLQKMLKNTLAIVLISSLLSSCGKDTKFVIGENRVGPITKNTLFSEVEVLFASDSLVTENGTEDVSSAKGDIIVFEKGGTKLLQLSPSSSDTNKQVKFIQIYDERYTTRQGINLNSTFKNIQDAYTVSRIENLIATIVIFVEEGDEYFTIDKKHLSSNFMFDTDTKIEATQIPDEAPIKYLMIGW